MTLNARQGTLQNDDSAPVPLAGCRYVWVAGGWPHLAAGDGPGRVNIMASPTTENLRRLARLLEDGTVAIQIQQNYPLADAADALQALASRHTQGKIALSIA